MNYLNQNIRLLSPDAAESVDPLSSDVGEPVKYPLLVEKLMQFQIRNPEKKKSEAGNDMLVVPCYTMSDERSTDGDILRAGFRVTHRVMLTPTETRQAKNIANDIKSLCQATGITGKKVSDIIDDPSILNDKTLQANVKISPAKGEYEASNSLRPVPIS